MVQYYSSTRTYHGPRHIVVFGTFTVCCESSMYLSSLSLSICNSTSLYNNIFTSGTGVGGAAAPVTGSNGGPKQTSTGVKVPLFFADALRRPHVF
jgi:hypothetical protein